MYCCTSYDADDFFALRVCKPHSLSVSLVKLIHDLDCVFFMRFMYLLLRVFVYIYFLLLLFGICFDSMSSPQHFYCPFSPELIFFSLVINEFKSGLHLFDMLMCYCIWVWFSCLPCFAFNSYILFNSKK